MTKTILLIDDEPDLISLLDYNFTQANYVVLTAKSGPVGVEMAQRHAPDLIILDIMMPGMDGWDVCKVLREDPRTRRTPILILTARAEEADRVLGLELGADDYVTKPFSMRELLARVKAQLRRTEALQEPAEVVRSGGIVIDAGSRQVTVAKRTVHLTPTEFNLLRALAERSGRVMTREELIALGRGEDATVTDRSVDVHISSLRKKLGPAGERVETVRSVGYRLSE